MKGYLQLLLCKAPKRGTRDDFRYNNTVLYYCSIEPITGDVGHVSTNHVLLAVNALSKQGPTNQTGGIRKGMFFDQSEEGNYNYTGERQLYRGNIVLGNY